MESQLLTTSEAAKTLRVTPLTLRKWANDGKINAKRAGRAFRFRSEDVKAFLDGKAEQQKAV